MQNGGISQRETRTVQTLDMSNSQDSAHRSMASPTSSMSSGSTVRGIVAAYPPPPTPAPTRPIPALPESPTCPGLVIPQARKSSSKPKTKGRPGSLSRKSTMRRSTRSRNVPQSAIEERERLAGDVRFSTVYGNHILVGTSAVSAQVVHVHKLGSAAGDVPPVPAIPAGHNVIARPRPSRSGPMLEVHVGGTRDSYFSVHSTVNGPLPSYYPNVDPSIHALISPQSPLYSPGVPSPLRQTAHSDDVAELAAHSPPRPRAARRAHSVRSKKTRARMPGSAVSRSSSKSSTYSKRSAYSVASPRPGDLDSLASTPELPEIDQFPPMPPCPPPPPPQRTHSFTRPISTKLRKAKPARIMLPQEILAMEARRQSRREEMSRLQVKQDTLMQAIAEAPLSNPGAVPGWGASQMASINSKFNLAPAHQRKQSMPEMVAIVSRPSSISRKPVPRPFEQTEASPEPGAPASAKITGTLSRQPSIRASRITRRSTIVNGGSRARSTSKSSFTGIPSLRLDREPLDVRYSQFRSPAGSPTLASTASAENYPAEEMKAKADAAIVAERSRGRSNSASRPALHIHDKALPALPASCAGRRSPVAQETPGRSQPEFFPLGFDPAIVTHRSPLRRSIGSSHRRSDSDSSTGSTDSSGNSSAYLQLERPTSADLMRASYYEELRRRFDEDFAVYHGQEETGMRTPPLDADTDSASSTSGSPPLALPTPPPPLRIQKKPAAAGAAMTPAVMPVMPVELPAEHGVFAIELDSRPMAQAPAPGQQTQPALRYTQSATARRPVPSPVVVAPRAHSHSRTQDIVRQQLYDPDPNEITTALKGAGDPFYSPTNYRMPSLPPPVPTPSPALVPVAARLPVAAQQPQPPKKRELPLFTRTVRHTAGQKPAVPPVRQTPFFLDVKTPGSSVVYTSSPPLDKRWEAPSPAPAIPRRGVTTGGGNVGASSRPRAASHSQAGRSNGSSVPPPPVPPLPRSIPPPIPNRPLQTNNDIVLNRNSEPIANAAEHVLSHYTPGTLITVQNHDQASNPMHHVSAPAQKHWRTKSSSQPPPPAAIGAVQANASAPQQQAAAASAAAARDRQTMKERLEKAFSRIGERGVVEINHGQHQSTHPPMPPVPPMPAAAAGGHYSESGIPHGGDSGPKTIKGHASKGSLGSSWKKFHSGVFGHAQ
ncbi:hypothetical protein DFH27DRAFT_193217 [Peziza echinospora]|nr:hypothetical protein DFH27DRAFT_193217 [Peziza echinospora]